MSAQNWGIDGGTTRGAWEPNGTPWDNNYTNMQFVANGLVTYTFDLPDGYIVNAVYHKWHGQGNQTTNAVYSYDEGTHTETYRSHISASPADIVIQWRDSTDTGRNVNFGLIFSGPITVSGGDGFTVTVDSTVSGETAGGDGNNSKVMSLDAILIDFTSAPPPASAYEDWADGAVFEEDDSGDGIPNGVAWVLGAADPTVNVRGEGLLPTIETIDDEGEEFLVFTFQRRKAALDEAEVEVEYSTDLADAEGWTRRRRRGRHHHRRESQRGVRRSGGPIQDVRRRGRRPPVRPPPRGAEAALIRLP